MKNYIHMAMPTISTDDFDQILLELGCPPIPVSELELPPDKIKSLCIYPAMMEFFIWNPIILRQEYTVAAGNFTIPAPNANVIGIVNGRVSGQMSRNTMSSGSPFIDSLLYSQKNRNVGGIPHQYELQESKLMERRLAQSVDPVYGARKVSYNAATRQAEGFCTLPSQVMITWGQMSMDMDDIDPLRRREALKLAKSYTLRAFGQLRGQQNSNTGVEFNYQMMLDRADKLEEEVLEKWRTRTKVVVVRG